MQPDDNPTDSAASSPGNEARMLDPCQDAIATLYTYLDGELTSERRREIKHHLNECAPCFRAFGFEADLKALVASKCRDEVPESLRRRVADAIGTPDARF